MLNCSRIRFLSSVIILGLQFASVANLNAQGGDEHVKNQISFEESSCVSTLRMINVAEGTYWGGVEAKGYAGSLGELGPAGVSLIDKATASGKKDGYRFRLKPKREVGHGPIKHYTVTARPIKRLSDEQKSFFTDESGRIHFTTQNRGATIADPVVR